MYELEKNKLVDLNIPFKKKNKNIIEHKTAWITRILLKTTAFWIVAFATIAVVTPDPSKHTPQQKYFDEQFKNTPDQISQRYQNKKTTFNLPIRNILVQNSFVHATLEIVDPLPLSSNSFTQSIQRGDFVTFYSLLQKTPSLLSQNTEFGVSPLILAILYNQTDIVKEIFKQHAHLNEKFQTNRTLLSVPSFLSTYQGYNKNYEQYVQTRQLIINSGIDVSYNNYEFVRRNLNPYWENYWLTYFSQRQQTSLFKSILLSSSPEISKRYRDINALNNVLKY